MFIAVASVVIDRPSEAVFARMIDPASWPRWVEDVKRIDAPSPMKKGDAFDEVTIFRGDERWCRGEVVDVQPGRLLVLRIVEVRSGPELLPTRRFELAPAGHGTRVTWTNEVEVRGLVRALQPILPSLFRKKMTGYLEALRRLVETAEK